MCEELHACVQGREELHACVQGFSFVLVTAGSRSEAPFGNHMKVKISALTVVVTASEEQ